MAFSEVYQALQTGTVDAQENSWSNTYASKLYEVQPYAMDTNHGYIGYFLAVNRDFWESLPTDIRDGLEEIIAEITAWVNERSAEFQAEDRQKVIDSGRTEVIELTPAEIAEWRKVMRPVWDQFRDEIGADLIEAAERSVNATGQ
jgi:C4-dicarboxylate-binding protein DctP